jgi:hypothetical protein
VRGAAVRHAPCIRVAAALLHSPLALALGTAGGPPTVLASGPHRARPPPRGRIPRLPAAGPRYAASPRCRS